MAIKKMLLASVLALSFSVALACLPDADFCVASPGPTATPYSCKDPKAVTAEDFFCSGADKRGNTSNPKGSKVTSFMVEQIPGLNTLGLSLARVDYAPGGINPPHTHPRASEIFTVIEGSIEAGFISGLPETRLFSKVLQKGDTFVFPCGLIHYQKNVGKTRAAALAVMNNQSPGMVPVASSLLHATPTPICADIVSKALEIDVELIKNLQSKQHP